MSVTCSSQGSRAGGEDLFQQSPELAIAQRAETDYDLTWLTIMSFRSVHPADLRLRHSS